MSLRLKKLVDDDYSWWYYHEPTGLLLHNNSEYGWIAVTNKETVESQYSELTEAIEKMDEFTNPEDVLPLPSGYK